MGSNLFRERDPRRSRVAISVRELLFDAKRDFSEGSKESLCRASPACSNCDNRNRLHDCGLRPMCGIAGQFLRERAELADIRWMCDQRPTTPVEGRIV